MARTNRPTPPCIDAQEVLAELGPSPQPADVVNYFVALFNEQVYPAITEVQQVMNGGIGPANIERGGCGRDNIDPDALRLLLAEIGIDGAVVDGAVVDGVVQTITDDDKWIEATTPAPGTTNIAHIGPEPTATTVTITSGTGEYLTNVTISWDAKGHVTAASGTTTTLPSSGGATQGSVPLSPLSWWPSSGSSSTFNAPASLGWILSDAATSGGSVPTIPVWAFADAATTDPVTQIETSIPTPIGFSGSGTLHVKWLSATNGNSEYVTWGLRAASMGGGDDVQSKVFDTVNTVTTQVATTAYGQNLSSIAITNDSSLAYGDDLQLVLFRDTTGVSDNHAHTVYVKGTSWEHGVA